jgi:glycosyltransferase involved in cell wall biosynthesis
MLLNDPLLREKISENARLLAEKYNWSDISRTAGEKIVNLMENSK